MIRAAGFVLALGAQPAAGQSCLPHWIQDSWQRAEAADAPYVVAAVSVDLPVGVTVARSLDRGQSLELAVQASTDLTVPFEGQQLAEGAFATPIAGTATLTVTCTEQACAGLPQTPWLAFLRVTGPDSYATEVRPCAGQIYADTPQNRAHLRACATGGPCVSAADIRGG